MNEEIVGKINGLYGMVRSYCMENEIPIELALPTIASALMTSLNLDVVALTKEEGDDGKQKLRMTAQGFYSVSELTVLPEPAQAQA